MATLTMATPHLTMVMVDTDMEDTPTLPLMVPTLTDVSSSVKLKLNLKANTTDIPMEVILTATPPGTMVDSLPTGDTLPPTTTTTDTCSKQSDLFLPNTKLYLPNQYHPSKVISSKLTNILLHKFLIGTHSHLFGIN